MRILIVKLGSIGDIVHTLPSLAAIRRAMPDAEISWIVEERSAEILRGNPMIDNMIEADTRRLRGARGLEGILSGAGKQVTELRSNTFDIAIDFQGLLKSGLIARLSGAKQRFGFGKRGLRESTARIFYTDSVDVSVGIHIIRKNLSLAAGALDITVLDSDFEFPVATGEEHKAEAEALVQEIGGGAFAVLNPAGGWVTKLWHAEHFAQLADLLWEKKRLRSIVVTGPNEDELAESVAANSLNGQLVLAQPSLKGFYELMKQADVYIGGDTGPTHIAVAAGAPVVGLFGPTEWWRNGSTNPDDICVERTDIDCRVDCHRRACTKWICMDSDVETVFNAVDTRLRIAMERRITAPAGLLQNR
ncbi:MAG: lipopolysaccharide heptosyltransferase I [Pyrinomonadaceae bacterium]